ncbi:UNVERIFIED_ORG: hypothetical protein ABIC72_003032 [Burkholderia sp. 1988]
MRINARINARTNARTNVPFFFYDGCGDGPPSIQHQTGRHLVVGAAGHRSEARMVSKHKNRWLRRWLVVIIFWAVPVAIVAVNEIREEMAYNAVDLDRALTTWNLTDAQRAAGVAARCHGKPDEAQAAGCPAEVLAANAPRQQDARNEYSVRRTTLMAYLWHAFVGYWVVPAIALFLFGVLIGMIRRALRRPPAVKSPANHG